MDTRAKMRVSEAYEQRVIDAALAWWAEAGSARRARALVELGKRVGELARARRPDHQPTLSWRNWPPRKQTGP